MHILHPSVLNVVQKLGRRIIKPSILAEVPAQEVDLSDPSVYLHPHEVFFGFMAKQKLRKMLDEDDITERQYDNVFLGACESYKASLSYILKRVPLEDPVIMNAVWINIPQRLSSKFDQVEFFVLQFKKVLAIPEDNVTDLYNEFSDYRALADHEIPTVAWEESRVTEEDVLHYRMNVLWWYLGQMKESGSQKKRFFCSQR